MKSCWKFLAAGLLAAASIATVSARGTGDTITHARDKPATTPEGAVQKVCEGCHDTEIVMDTPKSYDEWVQTIKEMIDRGAVGTPAEFDLVMDYLYKNMTTVNVNTAQEDDLQVILDVPDSVAQEIVARRQAKPFKDLADLETIPGLDAPSLEARKRMIFFN